MKDKSSNNSMTESEKKAWETVFFIENHLDYLAYPFQVSTPEQVEFMVITDQKERFYPCSDQIYNAIINRNNEDLIKTEYDKVYQRIMSLIDDRIKNKKEKNYLISLIHFKYIHETRDQLMIPARLEKRLIKIFLNTTQIEDPHLDIKLKTNQNAANILKSSAFKTSLNSIDKEFKESNPDTITDLVEFAEYIKFTRLLNLTTDSTLWSSNENTNFTEAYYKDLFSKKISGNGVNKLFKYIGIKKKESSLETRSSKKILWIAGNAGGFMFDLAIIRFLTQLGHQVIISMKKKPLYTNVRFNDALEDPTLESELDMASYIDNPSLTKNQLVETFKTDKRIFVISDGTGEDMNLLLTTTTFARIFKEVDCVVTRGANQKRHFFDTHFQFTQDIFNLSTNRNQNVTVLFKPKHVDVVKFSHGDLEKKAKKIILEMENARRLNHSIMFYSGIIGSIPGRIDMAKKIMSVFINYLNARLDNTHIINPSEYYEPGMDADDLMYMWEIVQKSGFIDIWRFQTYADIAKSFNLMNKKIPAEWVGKDSTYSTGCTKEMKIAIDVLRDNREMQIIGPAKEKFIRRKVYGIGKMYDERIADL